MEYKNLNIRNLYIDLLNKIKGIEGVDKEYVDDLVEVIDSHLVALDSDLSAISSVIPEEASVTNPLVTEDDLPPAPVNADWNASSGLAQILNKPTIPAAQVNSDWNASSGVAQILNKPTIPAAQVNSDWNASSGVAQILNKPTISSVGFLEFTIASSDWQYISQYQYYSYYGTIPDKSMNTIPPIIVCLNDNGEYNSIYEAYLEETSSGSIWYSFKTKIQPTGTIKLGVYYFY